MTETKMSNILIVDDELGIREGCRKILAPQGFNVVMAATIKEGLNQIQENHYDLVLLDIMMPDGRGIDLLTPIQEKDPHTISVIITGYATVELAIEAIKSGAYDFISKPFDAEVLLMTVNQGLEKRYLSIEAERLRQIEEDAAELTRDKEEMERLNEYKSNFMMILAHELRSPIGGVLSLVRTLLRGLAGALNEKQKEILSRIETRLNFILELINDLLTLASSQTVASEDSLELVSLKTVINTVIERLTDQAESKQITITFNFPKETFFVQATSDGLEKVFGNLIENAIKYTPKSGKVQVSLISEANQMKVRISDSGIGIPKDALDKIWDEFYRAPNAKQVGIVGTGLGLNIVKQYIDRFGGNIDVQSKEGKGSTFEVIFEKKAN